MPPPVPPPTPLTRPPEARLVVPGVVREVPCHRHDGREPARRGEAAEERGEAVAALGPGGEREVLQEDELRCAGGGGWRRGKVVVVGGGERSGGGVQWGNV